MIFTSENNWYSWSYGNLGPFSRQNNNLKFNTHFSKFSGEIYSFKEELENAARSILDCYPNLTPNIFFSGGVDSEIMLRAFLNVGANPKINIIRYENNYNIYDVSYAVVVCNLLNVDYNIIDINLEDFYHNEAERLSELAQIDRPRALPQCKFIEMSDGLPILGSSDLTVMRTNDDYSKKGSWFIRCWEHDIGWSKFARAINKPAVPEFFKWSPGLVLSFLNLAWLKRLTNDEYYGKLGINSTKIEGYREAYPDLITRKKQTGFEKTDRLVLEFESFLQKKYSSLPYRNFVDRSLDLFYDEIR